jgi:acetyl/propionyl-CoA carboxylase alpha subunit
MDTHVYAGYSISPFYDPMIAKLIVWGNDREEAVQRLRAALDEFEVEGIQTNIPFLRRLVRHPDYMSGNISTAFVPRMLEEAIV